MKTFSKICSLFLFSLLSIALQAQPTHEWTYAAGGVTIDKTQDIVVDDSGYVYVTGSYSSSVDFDPGPGVTNNTMSMGLTGFFFLKLDSAGNFIFVKTLPGAAGEGLELALDDSNHVFIAGWYNGSTDFDWGPGTFIMNSASPGNAFIMKVDRNGGFRWAKQLTGTGREKVMGLAVAPDGSVAMSGAFGYTVDFDPGAGTYSIATAGGEDGYLLRLDRNGNFLWAGSFGNSGPWDEAPAIIFDAAGNLYGTAVTYSGVDIDMGTGVSNLPTWNYMVGAVYKLDPSMNLVWASPFLGASNTIYLESIVLDPSGDVGISGNFKTSLDIDPGPGTTTIFSGSTNGTDDFLVKLRGGTGQLLWGFSLWGIGGYGSCQDLACDNQGAFYMTGYFHASHDFDPSPAVYQMSTTTADLNIYVAKYTNAGSIDWAAWVGGTSGPNEALALEVDNHRNVHWGGKMVFPADVDPGSGSLMMTVGQQGDVAVGKWQGCLAYNTNLAFSNCDPVQVNGQVYSQTGLYTQTFQTAEGCDSVLTIEVTINRTDSTINPISCGEYALNGQTYNSSGTYTQTLTNVHGCDSILTINLTVLPNSTTTIQPTTCDSFTAPDGQVYTQTGSYVAIIPNQWGCDSVVNIQLTVNHVQATVTNLSPTLTAQPSGALYQWLDCDNGMSPVPGANGQDFTPSVSGTYAVVVTIGNCSNTSACESVVLNGVPGPEPLQWVVHPNPSRGAFTVSTSLAGDLRIYNAAGALVHARAVEAGQTHVQLSNVADGLYWLVMVQEERLTGRRLLIQNP